MSFKRDLDRGELGGAIFFQAHEGALKKKENLEGDFTHVPTGETWELKTDFYAMSDTPNFFIEQYSNKDKGTPGGPWQALAHGATTFVYFYCKDMKFFKFNTQRLVDAMPEIMKLLTPVKVKNSNSEGYRVPRALLRDICSEHIIKVKVEDK